MHPTDQFLAFLRPLHEAGITYMVTGSVAVLIYGQPRLTNDIDLVLTLGPGDVGKLENAFPLSEFYAPPKEVLLTESSRRQRGHFNLVHHATGFKADVYFPGQDPLIRWALERRRREELEGEPCWVAPPEYVILFKLGYFAEGGSEKHINDIRGMLELTEVDFPLIDRHVAARGLQEAWKLCKEA